MNHVIKISKDLRVIVTFEQQQIERLTPTGLEATDEVLCVITTAKGLEVLGMGMSQRSSEDAPNKLDGYERALRRAVLDAFPDEPEIRSKIYLTFKNATKPKGNKVTSRRKESLETLQALGFRLSPREQVELGMLRSVRD